MDIRSAAATVAVVIYALKDVWALAAYPFPATQFVRTPYFKSFAAKPLAATPLVSKFQPLAAGHLQQNRTLAAKPLAATICSEMDHVQPNHLQQNRPVAAEKNHLQLNQFI